MTAKRLRVLIVDDEDNIVLALHRVLYQDNPRYDVLLARNAEIAQEILADASVDVLVTDVHLPERSGMDLLCWAAVESPHTRVIVMTAFDVTGIKDRAHAFGCLRLMRKPFDVHEMRATILRALDRRDGFGGSLSDLSSVDVIQMLCIGKKSTALRISDGNRAGVIHIESGELVHAVWEDLVGEAAFYQMLTIQSGLFYTSPLPPDLDRTLSGDWQFQLIEGLRKVDEAAHRGARAEELSSVQPSRRRSDEAPPSFAKAPGSSSLPLAVPSSMAMGAVDSGRATSPSPGIGQGLSPSVSVARLIDDGFTLLRAGRRDDARKSWEEALRLDPHNRMIVLNLRKLEAPEARTTR